MQLSWYSRSFFQKNLIFYTIFSFGKEEAEEEEEEEAENVGKYTWPTFILAWQHRRTDKKRKKKRDSSLGWRRRRRRRRGRQRLLELVGAKIFVILHAESIPRPRECHRRPNIQIDRSLLRAIGGSRTLVEVNDVANFLATTIHHPIVSIKWKRVTMMRRNEKGSSSLSLSLSLSFFSSSSYPNNDKNLAFGLYSVGLPRNLSNFGCGHCSQWNRRSYFCTSLHDRSLMVLWIATTVDMSSAFASQPFLRIAL
jgi:hypothetical protein